MVAVALRLPDPPEPHPSFRDIGPLAHPLGGLSRGDRVPGRRRVAGAGDLELGQRHQEVRLTLFRPELLEPLEGALGVAESAGEVALHEHEKGEIVGGESQRPLVLQGLVDRHRTMRVPRRFRKLPELLVVQAETGIDEG